MEIVTFATARQLIEHLSEQLQAYGDCGSPVHIALSGGSTPKQWFQYLSQSPYARSVCWSNLHFWWGDERCVPPEDAESNYGEALDLLFRRIDIPDENLHRICGEVEPEKELARFRNELTQKIPQPSDHPQFDWVILGVGADGHTASLFAGHTDYLAQENAVIARHPESQQLRISLTAPVLCSAKRLTYLVLGDSKAAIVREILRHEGDYQSYPAANIASSEGDTEWYLDRAAARDLHK